MVAKTTKGRITGLLAIPFETDVALAVGDHVSVIGPYKVGLSDGTKPVVGHVTVKNIKRVISDTASTYPVADTPGGKVTVDVYGFSVETRNAGGAIAAGALCGIGAAGAILAAGAGVATCFIALTTTTGAGQEIDLLNIGPR